MHQVVVNHRTICILLPQKNKKKIEPCKENIITPALSSMLDRTKTSNRSATFIVAATTASTKKDLSKVSVSKDTVRRTRQKHRESACTRCSKVI